MGLVELFRLLFSEDEATVIPINDDEIGNSSCVIKVEHSENMIELKELVEKLSSTPVGPAPTFELERNKI